MDKILPRLCIGINGKTGQYITAIDNGLIMNEEHMGGRGIRKGKRTDEPVKLATERKIKHMFNKSSIIMKQFKNLILAGALVLGLAGFAVSCDKYGDDIDELRDKVNTLASKDELSSQIASLQSALSAASAEASQASAEAATAKAAADKAAADAKSAGDAAAAAAAEANAAKAAADKAAADAKQAAIEALQNELETLKADLKEATDEQLAEFEEKVNAATEKVEALIGKVAGMVTSVELVYSYSKQEDPHATKALTFTYADEQANVFGKDVTNNPLTFEKGNQYFVPAEVLTVRVSPTNAVLTPDMITLVNSKGESLDCIEVLKVDKFNDLLTTKAAGESGLWNITLQLSEYDEETFMAATEDKEENKVLFAVKVNNTVGTEGLENRDVVSTYDITVAAEEYVPAKELNYYVDKTPIAKINNRYDKTSVSFRPQNNEDQYYEELKWNDNGPAVAPLKEGTNKNVEQDTDVPPTGDNRSSLEVYRAVQGKSIKVSLCDKDGKAYPNIRAFYVVLDKDNAVESAPSEWNAWSSYSYTGLNNVVEVTNGKLETEISVDSETAINDIIGFRVYAVNYDGTLVDPDGKAFYVEVGTEGDEWTAATTIVPESAVVVKGTFSDTVAVNNVKELSGAHEYAWTTDEIEETTPIFNAEFRAADGTKVINTAENEGKGDASAIEFSKIATVVTTPELDNWTKYEDNKAYTGTLTVKSATGRVIATIKVTFTKKLPTAAPAGFSVKTEQLTAENIWNAYLVPIETSGDNPDDTPQWTNEQATLGAMNMDNVFNFGEHPENYVVTFAGTDNDDKTKAKEVKGNEALEVIVDYIDNTTKHATTVSYNYGNISSDNKKNPYKVTVKTFQTVYNEIYNNTYEWAWTTGETPSVTYGAGSGEEGADEKFSIDLTEDISGTSKYDKIYNAKLSPSYKESVKVVSAKLTSNANGEEEYFTIDFDSDPTKFIFKPISEATRPEADVPSTLTVKYTDQYAEDDEDEAHTHEFTLDVIVKKR